MRLVKNPPTPITISLSSPILELVDLLVDYEIGIDRRAAIEQLIEDALGMVFVPRNEVFDRLPRVEPVRSISTLGLDQDTFEAVQVELWGPDPLAEAA